MKYFTFISLIISDLTGFTQQKQGPDFYLNSVIIDLNKVYLNENSIDSIRVEKKTANGAVYILTKDRKFTSITLANIVKNIPTLSKLILQFCFGLRAK